MNSNKQHKQLKTDPTLLVSAGSIDVGGQATVDKAAGPVGEALIMAAFGLAVAILPDYRPAERVTPYRKLAGAVRYTHYAWMVYGYKRMPIVDWMKKNAAGGLILVKDKSIRLEEYARTMIVEEPAHQDGVNKMLRKPGQTKAFSAN